MSQPPSLPPRCPIQNRGMPRRALDHKPQTTRNDNEFSVGHHRFPPHGSLIDEQPSWLDDLLTDSPRRISLQRSSSDPVALLEVARSFHGCISPIKEDDSLSDGILQDSLDSEGAIETGCGFEAGKYIYGPNSPRQKSKLMESESSIVTALLENSPINPMQYFSADCPSTSSMDEQYGKEDYISGNADAGNTSRRRSGQRSRVRKLQYIAELERTVDMLQTLGADLAAEVASLFQYRLALSVENKKLRQQIINLRHEKIIKDGQNQSLKNDVERLRMIGGRHRRSKSAASCFERGLPVLGDASTLAWQSLDLGNLSLGGNQVTLNHS